MLSDRQVEYLTFRIYNKHPNISPGDGPPTSNYETQHGRKFTFRGEFCEGVPNRRPQQAANGASSNPRTSILATRLNQLRRMTLGGPQCTLFSIGAPQVKRKRRKRWVERGSPEG
ncbi:hypothetical protein GWI33_003251 [Rhynchophorus ferrugineus]|uniref:Uncharacterized protein n=1 Tax=Rhynchophorus ferrugineus TaxID=354439 RepID=A0A834M176_RHYFE|nr:hypothetical protein GWI33_003251 [Rhynchophorus ferrugineus]